MVGAASEAVVFHREPAATTQMQENRLAWMGKNVDYNRIEQLENKVICVLTRVTHVSP